ncbi:MAG: 4a-hydroxytetrahydrobiopterin dehydratase [Symploca sp. SIO2E6]|nr:4a-hydroxytetrahydrobiopterin dehydratase [Symploca sp. SIO2E6]
MEELTKQKCSPSNQDAPTVTQEEIAHLKAQIPDWEIIELGGELRLERSYNFPNFQSALAFTNLVGNAAEQEGHHPALLTEYGKVTVTWWTHAISNLHKNDFIMAAKTDEIATEFASKK